MQHRVTARWNRVSLMGAPAAYDLVEIDYTLYMAVLPETTNDIIEHACKTSGIPSDARPMDSFKSDPGLQELVNIIASRKPDWIHQELNIVCECGADRCKTTHSTWCPKYLN